MISFPFSFFNQMNSANGHMAHFYFICFDIYEILGFSGILSTVNFNMHVLNFSECYFNEGCVALMCTRAIIVLNTYSCRIDRFIIEKVKFVNVNSSVNYYIEF